MVPVLLVNPVLPVPPVPPAPVQHFPVRGKAESGRIHLDHVGSY